VLTIVEDDKQRSISDATDAAAESVPAGPWASWCGRSPQPAWIPLALTLMNCGSVLFLSHNL
jgi:hypothetical protein